MASRYEVELTLSSAKDLKNVNWRHGPIKPYAVIWVDSDRKVSSRVDEEGDTCPTWNQTLVIPFNCPIEDATLHIDIVHAYASEDTKPLIGSAKLRLCEVVDEAGIGGRIVRGLKLKRPSGRPHGKVEVEVAVRQPRYQAPDPYGAPTPYGVARDVRYGGGAVASPYAAAPPPSGYPAGGYPTYGAPPVGYPGYGAPASGGYPYGQPPYAEPQTAAYTQQSAAYGQPGYGQPGYGQPGGSGPIVEEKKKSKFGGMGTGLAVGAVAGALGGLALAEGFDKLEDHIADEASERVEDDLANNDDYDDGGYADDW